MNRRHFLSKVTQGTLALSATKLFGRRAAAAAPRKLKHWIWVTGLEKETPEEQQRKLEQFREAGVHAVLFNGHTPELLAQAKQAGLETHAWIITLNRGDPSLLQNHPDWFVVNRLGDSSADKPAYISDYHFLCPSQEGVREYVSGVVADLCRQANLDGVHLDYIRFPDVILPVGLWKRYNVVQDREWPQFDYCYCAVCRAAFKRKTGEDPLKLPDAPANAAWRQFRYDSVTRLVNHLARVAHRHRKQITAAVFPTPTLAKRMVRQDWVHWKLDAVLPMLYHHYYNEKTEWIEPAVKEGVAALPKNRPLYAGLYLPVLQSQEEFDEAVKYALTGGAAGVSLFGGLKTIKNGWD